MNGFVPALKFPTTLIIVDDNPEFLNNIELIIGGEYRFKSFASAKDALIFIREQEAALRSLVKKYLTISVDDAELSTTTAHLNINKIRNLLYEISRFALSAVIITDFAMPDMNGIELCEQIQDRLLKIIMLTGEAGFDLAVSGFNRKLIDQFVLKSLQEFFQEIIQYSRQLETQLFRQISKNLIDVISNGSENSIFYDPVFIQFFEDLVKKHNIVEYYLLDPSGSYILLDATGKVLWLLVKNEEDMKVLYEVAYEEANDNKELLDSIKHGKKIAFFFNPEEQLTTLESWRLEDSEILKGRNNYYYSIIHGTDEYYKLDNKIVPYRNYLKG